VLLVLLQVGQLFQLPFLRLASRTPTLTLEDYLLLRVIVGMFRIQPQGIAQQVSVSWTVLD
jgi:hypothetical protein